MWQYCHLLHRLDLKATSSSIIADKYKDYKYKAGFINCKTNSKAVSSTNEHPNTQNFPMLGQK